MNQCRDFGGTVFFAHVLKRHSHRTAGGVIDQKMLKQRCECMHVGGSINGILAEAGRSSLDQTLSIESLMKILVPGIGHENGWNTVGGDLSDGIRTRSRKSQISGAPGQPHAFQKRNDRCRQTSRGVGAFKSLLVTSA